MREGFARDGLVHVGGSAIKPRSAPVEAAFTCAFGAEPELHQLLVAGMGTFPLSPEDAPQAVPQPFVQFPSEGLRLAQAEVVRPSA